MNGINRTRRVFGIGQLAIQPSDECVRSGNVTVGDRVNRMRAHTLKRQEGIANHAHDARHVFAHEVTIWPAIEKGDRDQSARFVLGEINAAKPERAATRRDKRLAERLAFDLRGLILAEEVAEVPILDRNKLSGRRAGDRWFGCWG